MPRRRHLMPVVLAFAVLLGSVAALLRSGPDARQERAAARAAGDADAVPRRAVARARSTVLPAAARGAPAPAPPAPAPTAVVALSAAPRVVPGRTVLLTHLPARSGDPAGIARALLAEHRDELGLTAMPGELVLEREIDSLSGHHVRYVQSVGGVPVFGSRVSAHVAPDGRPLLLRADVYPLAGIDAARAQVPVISSPAAAARAVLLLAADDTSAAVPGAAPPARVSSAPELVILPRGRRGVLAWHVGVRSAAETLRVFVDAADGAVLRADDVRIAADGRGLVFRPNPVHATGNGSLRDQGDRDQAALTNALELVTLPRLDGSGYLVGTWAHLRDSPVSTFRADLDWTWVKRSHHAFEQVMAYYHVDRVQNRLRSLGLTNVNAESQRVNAHAGTRDQSIYDVFDDRLEFGDGGVDDAEDADIIVHEYGHAVQFDQVGSFGLTGEGGAMGEGFGDFLAVVFHESARPAWDPLFASWDATAFVDRSPPFLRRVDRDKVFPGDYVDQVHDDGEIWSRLLMDLRYLIGADDALRVVIESHFYLTPNARFRHGCDALLVANLALREGRDDASIRALMVARGLPFTVPSVPLPPEEDSEDNDSAATAAPLAAGRYERFLLADEDWFRITVPPFSRVVVRADHDPAAFDMDLEAYTPGGARAAVSAQPGGIEVIALSAGPEGGIALVRCFHADPAAIVPGAYDLTVTETDLEFLGPVQTVVRRMEPGATWAFRIAVAPAKVDDGARLKLRTKKLRRGAKTDLRLFTPDRVEIVAAATARRRRGGRAVVDVDASGDWIAVVTAREGQAGRTKLRVKLK